ncbi:hypothetical protein BDC45DRAFT_576214 [Circinella umbellata]|nr:hypothetical protein BDC45DRAFT_576214 [Circinella umbellata]
MRIESYVKLVAPKHSSSNNNDSSSSSSGTGSADLEKAEAMTTPKPKVTKRKTVGSTTVTDSSKGDSCPLTNKAREELGKAFKDMGGDNKWKLHKENDKKIFCCAFIHSFILDLNDTWWESCFTVEEKKAMFEFGNWKLPPINLEILEIPDNHTLSVVNLAGSEDEEKYFIKDPKWILLFNVGPNNLIIASTILELSVVRVNSQRTISGTDPKESQHRSVRPDILLIKDGIDVAVGETVKLELVEKNLHL